MLGIRIRSPFCVIIAPEQVTHYNSEPRNSEGMRTTKESSAFLSLPCTSPNRKFAPCRDRKIRYANGDYMSSSLALLFVEISINISVYRLLAATPSILPESAKS